MIGKEFGNTGKNTMTRLAEERSDRLLPSQSRFHFYLVATITQKRPFYALFALSLGLILPNFLATTVGLSTRVHESLPVNCELYALIIYWSSITLLTATHMKTKSQRLEVIAFSQSRSFGGVNKILDGVSGGLVI